MTISRMDRSSKADWDRVLVEAAREQPSVAERVIALLGQLQDLRAGFAVDQLTHSLQTATRAERAGADDEVVVAALVHDVGKAVDVVNHASLSAEIARPYVRPEVFEVLRAHQDFEGRHYYHHLGLDPDVRQRHRHEPWFDLAARFADDWDQCSFEPDYDTLSLEHFEERLRLVFDRPPSP